MLPPENEQEGEILVVYMYIHCIYWIYNYVYTPPENEGMSPKK